MNTAILIKTICSIVFFVSIGSSCNRNSSKHTIDSDQPNESSVITKPKIQFESPAKNAVYPVGKEVNIQIGVLDSSKTLDSIQFLIDGRKAGSAKFPEKKLSLNTSAMKLGSRNAEAIAFFNGGTREFININFTLVASAPPKIYTYKILNTYPHDINAFTQGLIYEDGDLYEGTGIKGESSLRKEKLTTGEMIQALRLPSDVFGEGVCAFDDKLIQITWTEQIAYIYDKATFKLVNKLNYPMKEGWGITYDGKNLIMSDGTSHLYFLDKNYLSEVSRIEVCDEHGPVDKLNELEYINGEVWANVWQTDSIVRINPKNGEITGKIGLAGLLKPEDKHPNIDVLNGIAFEPKSNRILVTGKYWPKIFEISIYQKQ